MAMSDAASSRSLRASDAERERAAELLRDAMASGRITVDELDERTRQVFAAATRADLESLLRDVLVPSDDRHPVATPAMAGPAVRPGGQGTRRILSILSGHERKGRWRLAESCSVINVLGGSEIDLSEAELAAPRVELKIVTVLGGAEIRVPDGLNVEISELSILGGNGVDVGEEQPAPDGPVVHLRLVTILGGVEVKRGPKLSRRQRRELRSRRREVDSGS
jgi:Domain of unknown function (DUF1707)